MFSTLDQSLELESCPDGEDCASRELLHYAHYDHTELVRQRLETLQCHHVTSLCIQEADDSGGEDPVETEAEWWEVRAREHQQGTSSEFRFRSEGGECGEYL